MEDIERYEIEKERQEANEHQDALLAVSSILKTKEGLILFKYLFKNLDVTRLPDRDLPPELLKEVLGFLRAGRTVYEIACEADSETAAKLIAKLERERHDERCERFRLENAVTD